MSTDEEHGHQLARLKEELDSSHARRDRVFLSSRRAGMTALAGLAVLAVTGSEVLLSHEAMMKSAALTPKERRERAERNKKKHPGRHGKSKRR